MHQIALASATLTPSNPRSCAARRELTQMPPDETPSTEIVLTCAECGALSPPDALGWRALLGYDPREDEQAEAFVFCPACAEREFGGGFSGEGSGKAR
jgi:hypothetical protein